MLFLFGLIKFFFYCRRTRFLAEFCYNSEISLVTLRLPFKALFKQRGRAKRLHFFSPSPSKPCTAAPIRALSHRHCSRQHEPPPPPCPCPEPPPASEPQPHSRALTQFSQLCPGPVPPRLPSSEPLQLAPLPCSRALTQFSQLCPGPVPPRLPSSEPLQPAPLPCRALTQPSLSRTSLCHIRCHSSPVLAIPTAVPLPWSTLVS